MLKKLRVYILIFSILFILTGCETKEIVNETQTITKVFEIKADSLEEINNLIEDLPSSIEYDGKVFEMEGDAKISTDEANEKFTIKKERKILTNNPFILYRNEILNVLSNYGMFALIYIFAFFIAIKLWHFIACYYDLYWKD